MALAEESRAVRALVGAEPPVVGDPPAVAGWIHRLCRAATRDLTASGVGVSVVSETGGLMAAGASGEASALVEELQFTLGEGPCLDAHASRQPVLVPDLTERSALATWPGYAPAAHGQGVWAVFSFPLQVGTAGMGALDVYRDRPGPLSEWAVARAATYADVALRSILDAQDETGAVATSLADADGMRMEVHQAQGMVMVQLGVPADEALARIRAHAYAHERKLGDVARDLITRRLVLESDRRL